MRLRLRLPRLLSLPASARNGYCCKALCVSPPPRLFPGKLFVKENDVPASRRQQRTCQSARRTASDDGNGFTRSHVLAADFAARILPQKEKNSPTGSKRRTAALASSPRGGVGKDARGIRELPLLQRGGAGQPLVDEQSRNDQDHGPRYGAQHLDDGLDLFHLGQNFDLILMHLGF